jgi:hypothetical protein
MVSMDEVLSYVQQIDPLWAVVLVAIALAVLVIVRLWGSSLAYLFAGVIAFGLIGAAATAAYYGYAYFEEQKRIAERRVLEERAEKLFSKAVAPDSVFACVDGSPVPAMLEACERSLFAEPQRVAAAVAIVTQRLNFLGEALAFASDRDPSYARRVAPMLNAVESDPYGFVAFALSVEHGCTHEACPRFSLFRDANRVRENMRSRRLEAYLIKYANEWRGADAPASVPPPVRTSSPVISVSPDPTPVPSEAAAKPEPAPAVAAEAAAKPSAAPATAIVVDPPAAALAPILTPPSGQNFAEPPRPAEAPRPAPAKAATVAAPKGETKEAKGEAKTDAKAEQKAAPRPATQAKAKVKSADPVSRPSSEPVAGLPRVVPSEYIREKEEKEEAAQQAAPRAAGAPTPISPPQQNFSGN